MAAVRVSKREWSRSLQRTDLPGLGSVHRHGLAETDRRPNLKKLPAEFKQRLVEALMAEGYRESSAADRALAEADMAAGFETLPA